MAAIVINRVTWNKISPEHQREILRATQRIAAEFDASMPRAEASAIASMDRSGLTVNQPTAAQETMWRTDINNALPLLLGSTFDTNLFNQINNTLQRIRSGQ
jgi:TRAP-type C4-dicarboxylate transport system substrate-binding protein